MTQTKLECSVHPLPIIDQTNGIVRTTRLQAPSHFVWKVESYSTLLESELEKVDSGSFEVDGRKWKLTFYPNGDPKHKEEGYISLYLSVLDSEKLPLSCDIFVKFKFLVFDQIHDKYLVIQDVNEVCRFQRMKTEWGFAQLLSHDVFKEPSNGYLLHNCCIFGVDVFVFKGATRGESFSIKPVTSGNSYTFKIEHFSTINKQYVESEIFTIQGMNWKLKLYPKGPSNEKDNIALFLLLDSKLPDFNSKVYVKYKLRLIDQLHGKHLENPLDYGFHDNLGFGLHRFVSLVDVKNASKGYLVNDSIMVQVQIDYVSTVKHLS